MSEIIKRPRLELADNGYIVSWEEYCDDKESGQTYSSEKYIGNKKQVFTIKEEEKAMAAFKQKGKEAGLISGDSDKES